MNNIDFLPAKFREHNLIRRKRIWRVGILGLFGTVLLATAAFQVLTRQSVQRKLEVVQMSYKTAVVLNDRLAKLQVQLSEHRERARLATLLDHRWPMTQLLSRIVRRVPETITFSKIDYSLESVAAASSNTRSRRRRRRPDENENRPSIRQDLKSLRELVDNKRIVLELVGSANNIGELHQYVTQLSKDRLFIAADLTSLVERDFTIRLTVRPGYGQPDGPVGELDEKEMAQGRE